MESPFSTEVPAPTGTVSYLFTDIVGSTPLWDTQPEAMGQALVRHDRILADAFASHDGYVFSIAGDGYGAAFPSAQAAVDAAVIIQSELAETDWPESAKLTVRMGVHTGESEERDGNYFGTEVNKAARVMSAAQGGQLVVSSVTADLLRSRSDVELLDLGSVALTGLGDTVHLFGVSTETFGWLDLPLRVKQTSDGNLPLLQTDFVGDIAEMRRRAADLKGRGLITVTGPGGIGKTRAAVEFGWQMIDEFPDGVWLAELAPVSQADSAVAAVASTLAVQPQPGMSTIEAIVDWCLGRRMMLILDNCEHVLDPMAELARALLAGCPTVTVLATSQEPLHIPGENVFHLPSLGIEDSVALFHSRAKSGDNRFEVGPDDTGSVREICRRLDGMPLAVELAAARCRTLSLADVARRLDDRLQLLRSSSRTPVERHRTLLATVEWSYQLLSEDDQMMFDRLSVFAGSFDVEAVVSVLDYEEYQALELLDHLVDKSMITVDFSSGATRYRLLETLRQYGSSQLAARSEVELWRDRHLAYYTGRAEALHDRWMSSDQAAADEALNAEWDNLRAAHRWALQSRRCDEAQSIIFATSWHAMEWLRNEHRLWSSETLDLAVELDATRSTTYAVAAAWAYFAAELDQTIAHAQEGLRRHPDDPYVGGCLSWSVYGLLGADRPGEVAPFVPLIVEALATDPPIDASFMMQMALTGIMMFDESDAQDVAFTDFCRRLGSPMAQSRAALLRGNRRLSIEPPDLDGAAASFREAIALGERHARSEYLWAINGLAVCLVAADDEEAAAVIRDAITTNYNVRLWFGLDMALGTCASYLLRRSREEEAAVILGHISVRAASAIGVSTKARLEDTTTIEAMPEGQHWMATGRAMDRHHIVTYAVEALDSVDAPIARS